MSDKAKLQSEIGKIVTLKSNHLKTTEQYESIFLGGEPTFITPLMVIKEVLKLNSDKIDEDSGKIKNVKGNMQFRCIWFSNKLFKFEEAWFFENELDFIAIEEKELPTLKFGDNVVLKTNHLELKKRKTFLEIDKEKTNNKASALLNFCSPVFIHIGYANVEKKESLIDPNNGEPKRAYCSKLVKLKSFNVKEDKYSEFLVPVEAVEKIIVPNATIEVVTKIIQSNENLTTNIYYRIEKEFNIFKPLSISTISNFYSLKSENIFTQIVSEIPLNDEKFKKVEILPHSEFYPDIVERAEKFHVKSILEFLQEVISVNLRLSFMNLFRNISQITSEEETKTQVKKKVTQVADFSNVIYKIGYKNKHEKYTNRFVIPFKLIDIEKIKTFDSAIEDGESKSSKKKENQKDYYLRAFCLLRNDYRYFNIERMQYLEVQTTKDLVETALEIWKNSDNRTRL